MTFYNREGILYIRKNGLRVSTKLEDTPKNRKLVESYHKNDDFLNKFEIIKNIPTVLELCEEVLLEKEKQVKRSSMNSYLSMYKSRIVPFFDKEITYYKPKHIELWYKEFKDKSSILTCEAVLKRAFEKAILRGFIDNTPFLISKPKFKNNYEPMPFNFDEIKKILSYRYNDVFINFFGISIFTGIRTGELLGLKWSDIDFDKMTISINRTFTNSLESTPKTKSSKATIDLPIESLVYLRNQQLKNGLREYVFYNRFGNLTKSTTSLNRTLRKILSELDIDSRNIYQTRHTFASLKLSFGERLEWVSYMMRHKDTSITLRKYFKYIPNKFEKRVIIDFDLETQKRHS